MPKMKTRRGAAKRFKATANGFKRKQAFKRHILTKKSAKRIRQLRGCQKKRQFRALWIARINAGARQNGLSYSRMIAGLKKAQVIIDRRVLADIAMHDAVAFAALASKAKDALAA